MPFTLLRYGPGHPECQLICPITGALLAHYKAGDVGAFKATEVEKARAAGWELIPEGAAAQEPAIEPTHDLPKAHLK